MAPKERQELTVESPSRAAGPSRGLVFDLEGAALSRGERSRIDSAFPQRVRGF